jgi:hypothetical protein
LFPTGLGFRRHEHLCRISVRTSYSPFHGPQVEPTFAILPFVRFVPLRLPRTWTVRPGECPVRSTPRRWLSLYDGTGILTSFPFETVELRCLLGSANPRLTNSAEEPLLFRPSGFTPDFRCYYDQDFRLRVVHASSRPSFHPHGAPTYATALSRAWPGFGGGFEPR